MQAEATLPAINERTLPPQLRRLVKAIGVACTLALLQARGGTALEIPKRGQRSRVLMDLLGPEAAEKIALEFADTDRVMLPVADKIVAQIRDAAIVQDRSKGRTLAQLAIKYQLTIRSIQKVLDKTAGPSPQQEMF